MCVFQLCCPQDICPIVVLLCHIVALFLYFKESPECLYQFAFLPTVQEGSLFSTQSPAFILCGHFDDGHSDWCEMIPHFSFDLSFIIMRSAQHLFLCFLAIHMLLWRNVSLCLLPTQQHPFDNGSSSCNVPGNSTPHFKSLLNHHLIDEYMCI